MVALNRTSVVLQQYKNKVSFQRNDSGIVLKFLLIILKGWQCFLFIREHFPNLLELAIAGEQQKCCF